MIVGCDLIIALKGFFLAGKLGVMRVVTSQLGFTRAFSIRVFITRNVVPTVIRRKACTLSFRGQGFLLVKQELSCILFCRHGFTVYLAVFGSL